MCRLALVSGKRPALVEMPICSYRLSVFDSQFSLQFGLWSIFAGDFRVSNGSALLANAPAVAPVRVRIPVVRYRVARVIVAYDVPFAQQEALWKAPCGAYRSKDPHGVKTFQSPPADQSARVPSSHAGNEDTATDRCAKPSRSHRPESRIIFLRRMKEIRCSPSRALGARRRVPSKPLNAKNLCSACDGLGWPMAQCVTDWPRSSWFRWVCCNPSRHHRRCLSIRWNTA
jgi:hypothetical protein